MPLPKNVEAFLAAHQMIGTTYPEAQVTDECQGAKFHSPKPLQVRTITLIPINWNTKLDFRSMEYIRLCGNCQNNLRMLNEMMLAADGVVPWEVRREFGNEIRAIAQRGWEEWIRRTS